MMFTISACGPSGNIDTITKGATDPKKILIKTSDTTYCHYSNETCKTSHVHVRIYSTM